MVISSHSKKKMALVFDFDSIIGSIQISFNVQTINMFSRVWAVLIGYSGTNFMTRVFYSPFFSGSTDGRIDL